MSIILLLTSADEISSISFENGKQQSPVQYLPESESQRNYWLRSQSTLLSVWDCQLMGFSRPTGRIRTLTHNSHFAWFKGESGIWKQKLEAGGFMRMKQRNLAMKSWANGLVRLPVMHAAAFLLLMLFSCVAFTVDARAQTSSGSVVGPLGRHCS
jgi:hypothetical protein